MRPECEHYIMFMRYCSLVAKHILKERAGEIMVEVAKGVLEESWTLKQCMAKKTALLADPDCSSSSSVQDCSSESASSDNSESKSSESDDKEEDES